VTGQPSHLPSELRTLVKRYGTRVLEDADGLRATLDDFLDEGSVAPGDVNLLVDAVRFGSLDRLRTLLGQGADPSAATADVGQALAQRRGGDAESAYWACAVLGYAAELLPGELIPGTWVQATTTESPPSTGALVTTSDPGVESLGDTTAGRDETVGTGFGPAGTTHPFGGDTAADDAHPMTPAVTGGVGSVNGARPRRRWAVPAGIAAVVVLAAAVVYLLLTRPDSPPDVGNGNSVDLALVGQHNVFGHFGAGIENGTALSKCSDATVPGSDKVQYNCTFAHDFGPYYIELTENDPHVVQKGVLPSIVLSPPANTIVTVEQAGSDSYHAYYMRWLNNGANDKKNDGDDEVQLTLYDVAPEHPGAAIFTAENSSTRPLTQTIANELLRAIGSSTDQFPIPQAFGDFDGARNFASQFLSPAVLDSCHAAFTNFNQEFSQTTCPQGNVTVAFGVTNQSEFHNVKHRYRGRAYYWHDHNFTGELYTSRYAGMTRLFWYRLNDRQSTGIWGTVLAKTRSQALAYFRDFKDRPTVEPQ
jgi:hypothetical protein